MPLLASARSRADESANLDFLRACAVISVLVGHLALLRRFNPNLAANAHFGVLMFFVHTSLVLMMSMERLKLEGIDLFRTFYIRRFFRIYPLSIFFVLMVFFFRIPPRGWDPAVFESISLPRLISNLALTMNMTYSDPVIVPLWSLPYEVQMYFALPFLYLIFRRHPALWTLILGWLLAALSCRI